MADAAKPATRFNRRQRIVIALGGATLLAVVFAALATMQRADEMARHFEPRPLFPGLTERLNDVNEIAIESAEGNFHVRLRDDQGWAVVERDFFPADLGTMRATAIGIAELELVEAKTARAEWLGQLGLEAPADGGEAIRIVLSDAAGNVMADLLVGDSQAAADAQGRRDIYVRRTDQTQAWRARSFLSPQADLGAWLDKNVLDIARERIGATTVRPAAGPTFSVSRASPHETDFQLVDMPTGRELLYPGVTDSVATAITRFDFEDVRAQGELDFGAAAEIETRTFDGLIVTLHMTVEDGVHWAAISVEAGTDEAQTEAQTLNAQLAGWAFKLSQFQADMFLTTRESLLAPL